MKCLSREGLTYAWRLSDSRLQRNQNHINTTALMYRNVYIRISTAWQQQWRCLNLTRVFIRLTRSPHQGVTINPLMRKKFVEFTKSFVKLPLKYLEQISRVLWFRPFPKWQIEWVSTIKLSARSVWHMV